MTDSIDWKARAESAEAKAARLEASLRKLDTAAVEAMKEIPANPAPGHQALVANGLRSIFGDMREHIAVALSPPPAMGSRSND